MDQILVFIIVLYLPTCFLHNLPIFFEGGYARGECVGKEEWECECISANDVRVEYNFDIPEETTPSGSPEYENVETFDA